MSKESTQRVMKTLVEAFESEGLKYGLDGLTLVSGFESEDYPMQVRIRAVDDLEYLLVQVVADNSISKRKADEMFAFVNMLNHVVSTGFFEYDEKSKLVFYRWGVHYSDGSMIGQDAVKSVLQLALAFVDEFNEIIIDLGKGRCDMAEAVKRIGEKISK